MCDHNCCLQAIALLRKRLLDAGHDVCCVLETAGVDVDSPLEGSTAMHRYGGLLAQLPFRHSKKLLHLVMQSRGVSAYGFQNACRGDYKQLCVAIAFEQMLVLLMLPHSSCASFGEAIGQLILLLEAR
jgi:hypothetical protein